MKFKTDENLPTETSELLSAHGHDCLSVLNQKMGGASDDSLIAICRTEKRTLVTLDFDFSDIRHYPPSLYSGIIILKSADQSKRAILGLLKSILKLLKSETLNGKLWIVEENKIRIRE